LDETANKHVATHAMGLKVADMKRVVYPATIVNSQPSPAIGIHDSPECRVEAAFMTMSAKIARRIVKPSHHRRKANSTCNPAELPQTEKADSR